MACIFIAKIKNATDGMKKFIILLLRDINIAKQVICRGNSQLAPPIKVMEPRGRIERPIPRRPRALFELKLGSNYPVLEYRSVRFNLARVLGTVSMQQARLVA